MARKGVRQLGGEGPTGDAKVGGRSASRPAPLPDWEAVDAAPAWGSSGGPAASPRTPPALPGDVVTEIRRLGQALTEHRRDKLVRAMGTAVEAYGRRRYDDARKALRPLLESVPDAASVQEIAGLVAYHLGRWRDAVGYLTAYETGCADLSHRAVLMDAERALRHHRRVEELFEDLRQETPPADLLAEARMVMAGSLADRGELQDAIVVLTKGGAARSVRNPASRHLRQWYALADLYERGGDLVRARELYARILSFEPDAYDAADRLGELGGGPRSRKPKPRQRSTKA